MLCIDVEEEQQQQEEEESILMILILILMMIQTESKILCYTILERERERNPFVTFYK